jgi:glycosyltransferase involved in cell wall biosynthesis
MSLIGITALRYGKAVKLYTTHEHWLVCPMHVLWKFDREVCTTRHCIQCQLRGKRPPQLWRQAGLLDRMLRHVDCFISPSRFTLKKQLDLGLDIPIVHIPYFLPKPSEHIGDKSLETQSSTRRPYFLFVGRLEKIKGVQNLIPIFKMRPQYDLVIAGTGEYELMLKKLAGDAPNIKFLGRLNPEELEQFYRGAVAVIVPSICYETFGIIIIEAFSMKTPVIVNNLGALPEVIEDSGGGMIYNESGQLVEAMERLANDAALRDQLGRKGYDAYMRLWTEDAHMRQYLELVERLRQQPRDMATGEIVEKCLG